MKKAVYIILIWVIFTSLVLPCGSMPLQYDNYEEYEAEWRDGGTNIHYEQLSFLGEFVHYQPGSPSDANIGVCWKYRFEVGKELFLDLRYLLDFDQYFYGRDMEHLTLDDVENIKDMRTLKNIKANGELNYATEHALVITENIVYYYRYGILQYVFCKDSRNATGYFQFSVTTGNGGVAQYPYNKSDLFSRLLNYNTAQEALTEFEARIDGTYIAPWEPPLTIALSALSGAVVAAVTAWLITYFVMRKKAKNAYRLATNGENAALEAEATPDGAQDSTPTPPDN